MDLLNMKDVMTVNAIFNDDKHPHLRKMYLEEQDVPESESAVFLIKRTSGFEERL